jgi:hypothetical protein
LGAAVILLIRAAVILILNLSQNTAVKIHCKFRTNKSISRRHEIEAQFAFSFLIQFNA